MLYSANFDCSAVKNNLKKHYNELRNLPVDSMLGNLFAKEVITPIEKETMEKTLPLRSSKMEYLLDSVITPSLANNVTVKFKGFLEVMEESGDPLLISAANKLGMYIHLLL